MSLLQTLTLMKRSWSPLDDRWYNGLDLVPPVESGEVVNDHTALTLSAVYLAIALISGAVGMLPLRLMRRTGPNSAEPAEDHPLFPLLDTGPNSWQTSMEWRELIQGHVLLRGNGFSQIIRNRGGQVMELRPIAPDRVVVDVRGDSFRYLVTLPNGDQRVLGQEEVFHLKGLSGNGIVGHSPLHIARESFGVSIAAERHAARTWGNGARPSGILRTDEKLSNEARKNLQESWTQNFGSSNAYKTAVLDEGLAWQAVGITNEDAQFLESRQFQVSEVARWFNVPPHKLKDLSRATFANIEQQSIEFVQDTVQPWITRWEERLRKQLLSPTEQNTFFFKFTLQALLRADQAGRAAFYTQLFQLGALSSNDIRTLEDLNPIGDEGDQHFVQLNMVPLDAIEEVVLADPEPDPVVEEEDDDERALPVPALQLGPVGILKLRAARQERALRLRTRLQNRVFRGLLTDVARRIIAREQKALDRLIRAELEKNGLDSLNQRVASFYDGHEDYVLSQARPVLRQYMDEIREQIGDEIGMDDFTFRTDTTVQRYAETMAATHVGRSQRDLAKVLQLSGLEDDIETQLLTTVESWTTRRVSAIGIREATKAGGFFALTSMLAAGVRRMGWRAVGQTCPLCMELDGTIVSIEQAFRKQGDIVDPRVEGTKPLVVQTITRHPPLHAGCDCVLIPAA